MKLSFAEHIVELQTWESKSEMLDFLARCDAGSIVLGEGAEQEVDFCSATVHLSYSASALSGEIELRGERLGVGICSDGLGEPHLLLVPEKQMLMFGFNAEAVGVSVKDRNVRFRAPFNYSPFRSFLRIWQQEIVLVLHEIGLIALTEEGNELWRYEDDVIADCTIDRGKLHLTFMDSAPIIIDIASGVREQGP